MGLRKAAVKNLQLLLYDGLVSLIYGNTYSPGIGGVFRRIGIFAAGAETDTACCEKRKNDATTHGYNFRQREVNGKVKKPVLHGFSETCVMR